MFGLDKKFMDIFLEKTDPYTIVREVLKQEMLSEGIKLTDQQLDDFQSSLRDGLIDDDEYNIELEDDQYDITTYGSEPALRKALQSAFDRVLPTLNKKIDGLADIARDTVISVAPAIADDIFSSLNEIMPEMLEDEYDHLNDFSASIDDIWGQAFDLLQTIFTMIDEAFESTMKAQREADKSDIEEAGSSEDTLHVLFNLMAKSMITGKEILTLLRHGYADGAFARWRTLHERAVVTNFINKHGAETARRYIDHQDVSDYKRAIVFNSCCQASGRASIPEDEMEELARAYHAYRDNYQNDFKDRTDYKQDYSWAAFALNQPRPNFTHLETDVELAAKRFEYKGASGNVHANPAGTFSSIALPPSEDIMLAGR